MTSSQSESKPAVKALESLTAKLLALDVSDPQGIVDVGSELETVLESLPEVPEFRQPVESALECLRGLYIGTIREEISVVMGSIAEVLSALAGVLGNPDREGAKRPALDAAGAALSKLLAGTSSRDASLEAPTPAVIPTTLIRPADKPATPVPAVETPYAVTLPENADMDLLAEFVNECLDHIRGGEAGLLAIEKNPEDTEQIHTIFRVFHTIKGGSGFLGLEAIQRLAHLAESLLDRARNGQITLTGQYADLALESCDALRSMIEGLENVSPGGALLIPENFTSLMDRLAHSGSQDAVCPTRENTPPPPKAESAEPCPLPDMPVDRPVEDVAPPQAAKTGVPKPPQPRVGASGEETPAAPSSGKSRHPSADATIRVGTERLDSLINMVGELVIAQSMVAQNLTVPSEHSPQLVRNVVHVGKIVRELQDLSMSLRMVPLHGLFQKMTRLVRDLAHKGGKSIRLVTDGEDTEIDRNMVEVISDPLIHMIRNAVDHGIETPAQRREAGKEECGTVTLRASHAAGNIVIELQDDGRGLNRERIIAKAIERKLIEPGRELTDGEVFGLIFEPGFSTAEQVTDVSGRGVGMDVVRRNLESLRGRVDVSSRLGEGTTFTTRVPLTMAIADAMLLRVGKERYLLPTASIRHSFRPSAGTINTIVGRGEVVRLREELLPVFRLEKVFQVTDAVTDPTQGLLIVLESESSCCALLVDELLGQQQVVIKSLAKSFRKVPGIAGSAILGDGRVGLILDAAGLISMAHDGLQGAISESAAA